MSGGYQKTTPSIVEATHRLRRHGMSIRAIAAELGTTKAIIEAAIRKPSPARPEPRRATPAPRLEVYRQVRSPAPCPPTASSLVRRVYDELVAAHLFGELDVLAIVADLDVPRTRVALNALDADAVLVRLQASRQADEALDLDSAVVRLERAFADQIDERRQVRDRLRLPD
jgi:hypothetical protein